MFSKLFVCEALLINHWQYLSECRPLFLLWIFKCKNVYKEVIWTYLSFLPPNHLFDAWKKLQSKSSVNLRAPQSSIVKWGYQDNFKPVFFFNEKISRAQKSLKRKTNDFYPLTRKIVAFDFVLFCLWVFLCAQNLCVKKNTQAWNCLDNLILQYYSSRRGVPLTRMLFPRIDVNHVNKA